MKTKQLNIYDLPCMLITRDGNLYRCSIPANWNLLMSASHPIFLRMRINYSIWFAFRLIRATTS